jgi:hypothetical protein
MGCDRPFFPDGGQPDPSRARPTGPSQLVGSTNDLRRAHPRKRFWIFGHERPAERLSAGLPDRGQD